MHEREELRQVVAVVLDDLRERGRGLELQIALCRVGTDQNSELQIGHELEQTRVPLVRKIFARGQVTALPSAREVEVHGDNGQLPRVIEGIAIDPHPFAQAITAAVVPDDAAFLGDAAGSLADDHDPTFGSSEEERVNTALCERGIFRILPDFLCDCFKPRIGNLWSHIFTLATLRKRRSKRRLGRYHVVEDD